MSLFFRSFLLDSFVSSVFMNSLISSSHLFRGLPTGLFVLMQLSRQGLHSAIFLDHRSSGIDALLIAILHFILLCVSIQKGIFPFFICFFLSRTTHPDNKFGADRGAHSGHVDRGCVPYTARQTLMHLFDMHGLHDDNDVRAQRRMKTSVSSTSVVFPWVRTRS